MPLATKNNAIIVKDGKLAENCNCCGGWYCCPQVALCPSRLSVSVAVSASDVTGVFTLSGAKCEFTNGPSPLTDLSLAAVNIRNYSALSGTYSLPLISSSGTTLTFARNIAADSVGCSGAQVTVTVYNLSSFQCFMTCNDYHWQKQVNSPTAPAAKTIAQMKCSGIGTSSNDCSETEAYFSPSKASAMTQFGSLASPLCLPQTQTVEVREQKSVSTPEFQRPAQDAASPYRISGGTAQRTESGLGEIVAQITFSVD
jgi:hypothetical protein